MSAIGEQENNKNVVKDKLKKFGMKIATKLIIILLPVITVLLLISAVAKIIIDVEASWDGDKKGNPSSYTDNAKVSGTDGITVDRLPIVDKALSDIGFTEEQIENMTEAEIIENLKMKDKLKRNIISLDDCTEAEILWCSSDEYLEYLESPEDLEYLLQAELITQYPKIDGLPGGTLNGIIEFARVGEAQSDVDEDGDIDIEDNPQMLSYISMEEFDTKFNNYISTGNQEVFNYFTLDEQGNVVIATWTQENGDFSTNQSTLQNNRKKIKAGYTETSIKSEYDNRYAVTTNSASEVKASYVTYNATKTTINYKSYVEKYTLKFEYLWALLVMGESDDFALDLAELAYNSRIVIGIYDSTSTSISTDQHSYTEMFREKTTVITEAGVDAGEWDYDQYNYFEKNIITEKSDVVQFDIMYANTWVVEIKSEYKKEHKEEVNDLPEKTEPDEEWQDNGSYEYSGEDVYIEFISEKKTINKLYTTQLKTISDRYEKVETKVIEKTDLESDTDNNFVKILINDVNAQTIFFQPINVEWLSDILEKNDDTVAYIELTRYLINKAKNPDDASLIFDFSIFKPDIFVDMEVSNNRLAELLKSYENDTLRKYMNGDITEYSHHYITDCVTQDRTKYKLYYTEADGCLNFSYGIMVRNKNGILNNKQYFEAEGINLESLINDYNNGQDVYVDVEIIDRIYNNIVNSRKKVIRDVFSAKGVQLKIHELDALVNVSYQYGNCGQYINGENNIVNLYINLYSTDKIDEFKASAQAKTGSGGYVHFFDDSADRKKNNWILFSEGRYILRDGTELAGTSDVADFALQFVGQNHSIFTSYTTTTGKKFWGDHWCAMFVSYCYDNCGLIPDVLGEAFVGCTSEVSVLKSRGEFIDRRSGYLPQAGDIIFFTKNGGQTSNHTGLVVKCDGVKVYTVEGNTIGSGSYPGWNKSKVCEKEYNLTSSKIYGYFSPNQ